MYFSVHLSKTHHLLLFFLKQSILAACVTHFDPYGGLKGGCEDKDASSMGHKHTPRIRIWMTVPAATPEATSMPSWKPVFWLVFNPFQEGNH